MSDLISRGELLKRFLVNKDGHRIPERDCDNLEVTVSIKDVKTIIKEQPTAYDIDKIVEELEKLKMRYFLTIANTGDEKSDFAYENVGNALDKAIEIVKNGGSSDDVCEWKKSKDYPFDWLVGCDGCKVNHRQGDYCPRCGKKIKVVE